MSEQEKLMLKKVLIIIKSFGGSTAGVSQYYEFGGIQDFGNSYLQVGRHKINFPGLDEWIENKFESIGTSGILDDYGDQGRVDIDFDAKSGKILVDGFELVYDTDEQSKERELDDSQLEIFKEYIERGDSEIVCTYEGGGDSGYINSDMAVDSEIEPIKGDIENICYNLLESFNGWEINEGSQGNIVFNLENKTATINHSWNVERYEKFEIEVIDLN